jgi:hypothetical protein
MIGDDDSVSNNLLEVIEYMDKNDVDALNCLFATLSWPDIESKIYSTYRYIEYLTKRFTKLIPKRNEKSPSFRGHHREFASSLLWYSFK